MFGESILTTQAANSIAQAKKAVYEWGSLSIGPAMELDEELLLRTAKSEKFLDGVVSFIAKYSAGK
jgi:enoyl-CoA hydratase/carnithine racemase